MLELSVGHSGHSDFYSIQEALDQVPYGTRALIRVKKGVYKEKLFSDKSDITILGEGPERTVITFSDGAYEMLPEGRKRGTFRSYTAFFSGNRIHLAHVGIRNEASDGRVVGQSVALYLDVRLSFLEDVHLWSHQDTLFLAPLPEKELERRFLYPNEGFVLIYRKLVSRSKAVYSKYQDLFEDKMNGAKVLDRTLLLSKA